MMVNMNSARITTKQFSIVVFLFVLLLLLFTIGCFGSF